MASKLDMMKAAIEEINEKLAMDPAISTKGKKVEELVENIKAELTELYDTDEAKLKPETWTMLVEVAKIPVVADPEGVKEETPVPEAPEPVKAPKEPKATKGKPAKEVKPAKEKAAKPVKEKVEREPELPLETAPKTKAKKAPAEKPVKAPRKPAAARTGVKSRVYAAWQETGKAAAEMTKEDFDAIVTDVPDANPQSIRTWIKYRWSKGKDLPAGV